MFLLATDPSAGWRFWDQIVGHKELKDFLFLSKVTL